MSIETMKLARNFISRLKFADAEPEPEKVMQVLDQAIEQAQKQEPVAWASSRALEAINENIVDVRVSSVKNETSNIPLYTTPPQRQPLSDEQAKQIIAKQDWGREKINNSEHCLNIIRETEAAHGIKGEA